MAESAILDSRDPPEIGLAVTLGSRDVEVAPHAVEAACRMSINPVREVLIGHSDDVPADQLADSVRHMIPPSMRLVVQADSQLLDPGLLDAVCRSVRADRIGWVTQQLVKLRLVLTSRLSSTLVLDADTLLLRPRQFLDRSGLGILMPTTEFHGPYYQHLARLLSPDYLESDSSHVSHHALFQKDLLAELLMDLSGRNGGRDPFVLAVEACDRTELSACSVDYEMYAQWCLRNRHDRVVEAEWGNVAVLRGDVLGEDGELRHAVLDDLSKEYASVSVHWYL